MRKKKLTSLIVLVFVLLCNCDYFKSLCEPENDPKKQPTTLQNIVNNATDGEIINLEEWENITDYTATIDKKLTIKSGNLNGASLTVKAENVKLEKMQNLSVETSSRLTIKDSKLNNLLLGGNAQSRSNTTAEINVILENCEITEKIKINSQAKLNITGKKTKIAKIVVAVVETLCKIFCADELDTTEIKDIIVDEDNKKLEDVKVSKAYKIIYHSNCDEQEDIEDFFSPDDGTISLPTDIFKRNEYIFAGWYYDNNQAVEDSINVSDKTADIHVYAKWESKFYSYTSKIGNLIFEWGGGFSVLLLTDEQLEVCNDAKDFKQATAEKPEYQIAAFGDMIVDTTKEGNFAVYGRNGSKYDGVAVTIKDNTFTLFIDMTKITKTQLKGLWKDTGNGDEAFITEDDTVNLTGYKPYVIALTTQDKDVNNFKFRAWNADLMKMTAGATFPTNLQQSAPTTGNTNEVKELTATADTVADTIRDLSAGTYMLKVSGVTNTTITEIANAMNGNTEAKINLDLSGANGVTTIGDYAFFGCSGLTSITIPESVTTIDQEAFDACSNLASVTIGNGVTSIGDYAFSDCSSLTNVTIPGNVTTIGGYVFYNCSSLKSVTFNNTNNWYYTNNENYTGGTAINVTDTAQNADNLKDTYSEYYWYRPTELTATADTVADTIRNLSAGTYMLKVSETITNNTITEIANAIRNLSFETYINLDLSDTTGLTEIPNNAFCDEEYNGCTSLLSINIPDNVTTIGNYAFSYCENLTSIEIPDSVTTIGDRAFHICSSLTSVTIGNGVTSIGASAFSGCSSLTSITIPDSVTSIGEGAFYGCSILTSVTIPNSVTTIGDHAFCDCSSLTSVTIPNNVTTIGVSAFYFCENLTSIEIPNSVTTIGSGAFSNCSSLTSVTIPNSVTTIGAQAFSGCSGLTSVTFKDTNGWYYNDDSGEQKTINVTDTAQNAENLKDTYSGYYWYKTTTE